MFRKLSQYNPGLFRENKIFYKSIVVCHSPIERGFEPYYLYGYIAAFKKSAEKYRSFFS